MPHDKFQALQVVRGAGAQVELVELTYDDLPPGQVLVKVDWSSINYADAASVCGTSNIEAGRKIIPGSDLAGTVAATTCADFAEGDEVLASGIDIGGQSGGAYAGYCRLPPDAVFKKPAGLDARAAMAFGGAGVAAMIAIEAIAALQLDAGAHVLQTSITGGLASVAAALLTKQTYHRHIVAGGKHADYARSFEPHKFILRDSFIGEDAPPPVDTPKWDAVIDTACGALLGRALSQLKPHGLIVCCGATAGASFTATAMPFILRGATVKGAGSYNLARGRKEQLFDQLAANADVLELIKTEEVGLAQIQEAAREVIAGKSLGRVLVKLDG